MEDTFHINHDVTITWTLTVLTLMACTPPRVHTISAVLLWDQWEHWLHHKAATRWVTEAAAAAASPWLSLLDQMAPYFIPLYGLSWGRHGAFTCLWTAQVDLFTPALGCFEQLLLRLFYSSIFFFFFSFLFFSCEPGRASEVRRLGGINKPV